MSLHIILFYTIEQSPGAEWEFKILTTDEARTTVKRFLPGVRHTPITISEEEMPDKSGIRAFIESKFRQCQTFVQIDMQDKLKGGNDEP